MDLKKRKIIRLQEYDYSQNGAYFITFCVKNRHEMLGRIVGAGFARPHCVLSPYGAIAENEIQKLSDKYSEITINKYVVMPNHIHCILVIDGRANPVNGRANPAPTIGQIMGYLKYQTTKAIDIRGFWQRSYHDHIIRNENEYQKICQYIDENPATWPEDRYFTPSHPETE